MTVRVRPLNSVPFCPKFSPNLFQFWSTKVTKQKGQVFQLQVHVRHVLRAGHRPQGRAHTTARSRSTSPADGRYTCRPPALHLAPQRRDSLGRLPQLQAAPHPQEALPPAAHVGRTEAVQVTYARDTHEPARARTDYFIAGFVAWTTPAWVGRRWPRAARPR